MQTRRFENRWAAADDVARHRGHDLRTATSVPGRVLVREPEIALAVAKLGIHVNPECCIEWLDATTVRRRSLARFLDDACR